MVKKKIGYILQKRLFYALLFVATVLAVVRMAGYGCLDSDVYFILTEGRTIMESGIPYTHSTTVIANLSVVVQQWLWDALVYCSYSTFGYMGLFALTLAVVILAGCAIYKLLGYSGTDAETRLLVTAIALLLLAGIISIRPNLLNITILLFELIVLEEYKRTGKVRWLAWLPVMTLLVINLHASMWILNFLFILPYVFPRIKFISFLADMTEREYRVKPLLLIMLPMVATLFINPYGIDGVLYLFRSYGSKLNSIGVSELADITILSQFGVLFMLALLLYVVNYVGRRKQLAPERAYLYFGLMLIGVTCIRQYVYLVLAIVVLLTCLLENVETARFHDWLNKMPIICLAMMFAFILLLCADLILVDQFEISDDELTPVAAVVYLEEYADESATVYTTFNSGAYFGWKGYQIYIDARPELYMKSINKQEDVIDEMLIVMYDLDYDRYTAFKEKYQFDYWLGADGTMIKIYLDIDADMEAVVDGNGYTLYRLCNDTGACG